MSNIAYNQPIVKSNAVSTKNLEPVNERISEQRITTKEVKPTEFSSNESTPRIDEEEIIINTLKGGYSQAICPASVASLSHKKI